MRTGLIAIIVAAVTVGCAHTPTAPDVQGIGPTGGFTASVAPDGPHRLWTEATFYFPTSRDGVDVVPGRAGRFHLNALKFLEEYCKDCLEITKIKNNGDGTIDLTARITHPFPGYPEYTGFDVKGIIIFNGSFLVWSDQLWAYYLPDPSRISWRDLGDPEVLNADGYTPRWSLNWQYGEDRPIYRYWKGKYSNGTPNGDINAYLDFYTDEARHMFDCLGTVERTYKIWLPPGEVVVAGYAVEACWELPLKMPVTDPLNDFPLTANQPEPYHLKYTLNGGEPITDCDEMDSNYGCSTSRVELRQWGSIPYWGDWVSYPNGEMGSHNFLYPCEPPEDGVFLQPSPPCYDGWGNGKYRQLLTVYKPKLNGPHEVVAFAITDYVIDEP
jgi:hypothetical protein